MRSNGFHLTVMAGGVPATTTGQWRCGKALLPASLILIAMEHCPAACRKTLQFAPDPKRRPGTARSAPAFTNIMPGIQATGVAGRTRIPVRPGPIGTMSVVLRDKPLQPVEKRPEVVPVGPPSSNRGCVNRLANLPMARGHDHAPGLVK